MIEELASPGLSIIVVNWNTRHLLAACLDSILAHPPAMPYEIWVVDNGSADGSVEMVRGTYPWVKLIENEINLGFARANNQALERATGRYLLLLNSDTEVTAGALSELVRFADANPSAGVVGAKLINQDGSFQAAGVDLPSRAALLLHPWGIPQLLTGNPLYPGRPPEQSRRPQTCGYVTGACLLTRGTAVDQVGKLDEAYFMYSEEMDWCRRMWQAGWQVWVNPSAQVIHHGGASADRRGAAQRMRLYASQVRYAAKHHGRGFSRLVAISFRLSSLIKAVLYRLQNLLGASPEARSRAQTDWQVAVRRDWAPVPPTD